MSRKELLMSVADDIEAMATRITHPNGKRAYFVDSADEKVVGAYRDCADLVRERANAQSD